MAYAIHPIANIFPRMSGEEFVSLKADIKERGLLEPIWLYEGKVLDGRHREFDQLVPALREASRG